MEFLGVKIDNNLRFDEHVSSICLKANRKLSALTRETKFVPFKKRYILFKAFRESQSKYCPLAHFPMFQGRQINDKNNKLHERALRIVYNDADTSLLARDKLMLNVSN